MSEKPTDIPPSTETFPLPPLALPPLALPPLALPPLALLRQRKAAD